MTEKTANNKKPFLKAFKNAFKKVLAILAFGGAVCAGGVIFENRFNSPSDGEVIAASGIPSAKCLHELTQAFNERKDTAAPPANGRPVLVIPGFLNNDSYMQPLRERIRSHGYKTYGWEEGFNIGPDEVKAKKLASHLKLIYEENGRTKVSLVGYSLGGVYARELARAYPDLVETVVTLGAPISLYQRDGTPDPRIAKIRDFFPSAVSQKPPPLSAVFSLNDHIVGWRASLAPASELSENIPVEAGHVAMPFSGAVAAAILDRLGQKKENWQQVILTKCNFGP